MDYGGMREKKKSKVETWQVVRDIYWFEKNNKKYMTHVLVNKWY